MHNNIKVKDTYYEDVLSTVTENDEDIVLWNMPIQIDKIKVKANRPNTVMKDNNAGSCLLIDSSLETLNWKNVKHEDHNNTSRYIGALDLVKKRM